MPAAEQPNPNCQIPPRTEAHFAAAPREFHVAQPAARPSPPPMAPKAISEILEPQAAPARAAIEPDLPPDHPLEPGTRPSGRVASPSERIAASESAISEIPAAPREPVSVIELHRRRAPRRAGRRGRAAHRQRQPRRDAAQEQDAQRRGARTLDHHLQDSLAAGRRERGRDRARHVQDGDDAARQRQRRQAAGHREFRSTRRSRNRRP